VRGYFDGEGFLEVETPLRVRAPGQELHLDAVAAGGDRWLITSPEYHMKRLVGAGLTHIYQLARCFRAGERGPHHEPEFTMIEWYRAEPSLDAVARDCERLIEVAARAIGAPVPAAPFARTTVGELLQRHAGVDVHAWSPPDGVPWDDAFFQMWLDRVEPRLDAGPPTFVFDWPLPLGALARRKAEDPRVCERFELYAGGLELVNAFGELVDPGEQRARFEAELAERARRGKAVYPIDERLLDALGQMPPTCGAAMGFDRLVMLVLGTGELRDVVAFADDEV
jgi:lysyl-tRNA synthetase class 2